MTNNPSPLRSLIASIVPDLMSAFTLCEWVFVVLFMGFTIVFSFIDFNHFIQPESHPSVYSTQNDIAFGMPAWRRSLMKLSGAAAFTGALCVVLTNKGKFSCFFYGLINVITYGAFAAAYGYAGDTLLNLFYLVFQFLGIYYWGAQLSKSSSSTSKSYCLSPSSRLLAFLCAAAFSVGFWFAIPPFGIALTGVYFFEGMLFPRVIDACVCGLSVVAQTLLTLQYEEQWVLWILVDILSVIQWSGITGLPISINALTMWCLYLVNAVVGYRQWFRRRQANECEASQGGGGEKEQLKGGGDDAI